MSKEPEGADMLTEGMTPFDVLASVFGASLAPSELEEALAANGYDFERSMAWLVERAAPQHGHGPQHPRSQNLGSRVSLVSRDGPSCSRLCARWEVWIWGSKCGDKGSGQIHQRTAGSDRHPSLPVLPSRGVFASRLSFQVSPFNSRRCRTKRVSLATRLNAPFVASGCEGHARKGRFASFYTTSQQMSMWLVSPPQWAALTSTRVLLLVPQH
jgi:hypothetical protein